MKIHCRLLGIAFLILCAIGLDGCSKDESPQLEQDVDVDKVGEIVATEGITAESFDTYAGEIGFVLDTRELAKKGYFPATAEVYVEATQGDFSQTIAIDPISYLGQIKLIKENLSLAAIEELDSGVLVESTIKDANGQTIVVDALATISFQPNPAPKKVSAVGLPETPENRTIGLSEDTFYYFQPVDGAGAPNQGVSMGRRGEDQNFLMTLASGTTFNGNEPLRNFSFVPIPGQVNTFAIRIRLGGHFLRMSEIANSLNGRFYSHEGLVASSQINFAAIQNNAAFHFRIEKKAVSVYELQTSNGTPIRVAPGIGLTINQEVEEITVPIFAGPPITSEGVLWRLISTTIDWEVQNLGTTFLEPILGAAKTGFKFNSTLTNCGQGGLSQTVGVVAEEKEIGTVGWEESLSINTTNSVAVSATVGVAFNAKFFGVGANYSASVATEYGYSRTVTESSSLFEEKTSEISTKVFTERTVTVPSGSASLVYDAFQFYDNVKVNFAQRLRIRGTDRNTGQALSGEEIRSQFQFSGFDGVVLGVEPSSIVITLRGTKVLDQIVQIESKVEDVQPNCGS